MPALRLVFLGPPGTGKGTQAQKLSERFGWQWLSSGDVLRREMGSGSEVGNAAAEFVKSGTLVPDAVITGVMLACIEQMSHAAGFVLDGYPRTVPQARALDLGLSERGTPLHGVIDFRADDATIVERIVTRRVCNACGRTYNTKFLPPRVADRCDACGAALAQRVDDDEDVITTRLATYRSQTAPLVEYYAERGLLRPVNAVAPAADVEAELMGIVDLLGRGA